MEVSLNVKLISFEHYWCYRIRNYKFKTLIKKNSICYWKIFIVKETNTTPSWLCIIRLLCLHLHSNHNWYNTLPKIDCTFPYSAEWRRHESITEIFHEWHIIKYLIKSCFLAQPLLWLPLRHVYNFNNYKQGSIQIKGGTRLFVPSLKMRKKQSLLSSVPESTWLLLTYRYLNKF